MSALMSIPRFSAALLVAVSLAAVACGSKDSDAAGSSSAAASKDDKVASCNMPSAGSCREYRGGNLALGTDNLKKLCSPQISKDAAFADTACPTEKLKGTCKKPEGTDFYYEGSLLTLENAEKYCKDGKGTWTAK